MIHTLNALYDSTSSRTLADWAQEPGIGETRHAPRYEASRLPPRFREFFTRHEASRFGDVRAPLMLAMVNYNWSHKWIVGSGHSEQREE